MTNTTPGRAASLREQLVRLALVESGQGVKLMLKTSMLSPNEGWPAAILSQFPTLLPIDLLPEYPLNLDISAEGILADLSFGVTHRCLIPWAAVDVFAIGGSVPWREVVLAPAVEEVLPDGVASLAARRRQRGR